jgi:hypothetical protein
MTPEEAERFYDDRLDACYRPEELVHLYEIGKSVSYVDDTFEAFHKNFDCYECYETEMYILTKEALISIIQQQEKDVAEYYKQLLKDKDPDAIHSYLFGKSNVWNNRFFSSIQYEEGKDGEMTRSWYTDYAIFNLVHILKTFDFEHNYLIYSGW